MSERLGKGKLLIGPARWSEDLWVRTTQDVVFLDAEERVAAAEALLEGTGHSVTQDEIEEPKRMPVVMTWEGPKNAKDHHVGRRIEACSVRVWKVVEHNGDKVWEWKA